MVWATGVKVAVSSPKGGILEHMCECVSALRVMHLRVRLRLISPLRARNLTDCPTIRTLNQLENQSVRTADNRLSLSEIMAQKEGPVNPHRLVRDFRSPMGKSWPIRRQSWRFSFCAIIAAKDSSMSPHLSRSDIVLQMYQEIGFPYPRLGPKKRATLIPNAWFATYGRQWGNLCQSTANPGNPLYGPKFQGILAAPISDWNRLALAAIMAKKEGLLEWRRVASDFPMIARESRTNHWQLSDLSFWALLADTNSLFTDPYPSRYLIGGNMRQRGGILSRYYGPERGSPRLVARGPLPPANIRESRTNRWALMGPSFWALIGAKDAYFQIRLPPDIGEKTTCQNCGILGRD